MLTGISLYIQYGEVMDDVGKLLETATTITGMVKPFRKKLLYVKEHARGQSKRKIRKTVYIFYTAYCSTILIQYSLTRLRSGALHRYTTYQAPRLKPCLSSFPHQKHCENPLFTVLISSSVSHYTRTQHNTPHHKHLV